MLRILMGAFLIVHGLIHFGMTTVPSPTSSGPNTPFWPALWRTDSGSTWLVSTWGMNNALMRGLGTLLILVATVGFVLAGLGVLGVPGLHEVWRPLAVSAAAAAIPLFVLFWHPWMVVGLLLNAAVVAMLLWSSWPSNEALA